MMSDVAKIQYSGLLCADRKMKRKLEELQKETSSERYAEFGVNYPPSETKAGTRVSHGRKGTQANCKP